MLGLVANPAAPRAKSVAGPRVEIDPEAPNHVRHCYGTGSREWWIYTWARDNPAVKLRVPYQCRSWRCPACRSHESHVLFARIMEAYQGLDPRGFCFFVLTIDRDGYYSGEPWPDARTAFRELSVMSRKFLKRLWRFVAQTWGTPVQRKRPSGRVRTEWEYHDTQPHSSRYTSRWLATVEAHRSGWPHINLILHCPELAEHLRTATNERLDDGWPLVDARLLRGELSRAATETGWGVMCSGEAARDSERAAGYAVKVAGMAEHSAGEVAKLSQLPTGAPPRFRRLRSGRGFLPPRRKNEGYTGTLVRRRLDADGTVTVMPLHEVPDELHADVASCCYHEETIVDRERSNARLGKYNPLRHHEAVELSAPVSAFRRSTGPP